MINIRRWYIYLVCAITVQAVAWSLIALTRKVLLGQTSDGSLIALQTAVIIVSTPLFLGHWLWGERLAAREADERSSFPRRFYLYGMLAAALAPIANNLFHALRAVLGLLFGVAQYKPYIYQTPPTNREELIRALPALLFLALLWGYHKYVKNRDDGLVPEYEPSIVLSQLYNYLFSAVGLGMLAVGVGQLLEKGFALILPSVDTPDQIWARIFTDLPLIVVGLAFWLIFWFPAQRAFTSSDEWEQESVVRKGYLYLVVFLAALGFIVTATNVLADLLGRLFGLDGSGGQLNVALAIIIVSVPVWIYHAYVLRLDAAMAEEVSRQALVRRIYTYLMSGLALAAFLLGLAGVIVHLLREITNDLTIGISRRDFPSYLAVLLVGLVVWWWHWRRASQDVAQPAPAGIEERRSFIRKFYLYIYIFGATLTLLGSVIYIVSQILMVLIDARTAADLVRDISEALAYTVIAIAIWIYHGRILRGDGRTVEAAEVAQLKSLQVAVVDAGDGLVGRALIERLLDKAPGAVVQAVGLTETAVIAMNGQTAEEEKTPLERLAEAEVIVGPWSMIVPEGRSGAVTAEVAAAIAASQAQKILFPEPESGYAWAGVEDWKIENIAAGVADRVRALTLGEAPAGSPRLAPWAIVLIILVSLCVLVTVVLPFLYAVFFEGLF